MRSKSVKRLKLVVKNGGMIHAIYDDSFVVFADDAEFISRQRASHVEPYGVFGWQADMRPVGGPILKGFATRAEALSAEVRYINRHVIR